jgi:hypothetical protein
MTGLTASSWSKQLDHYPKVLGSNPTSPRRTVYAFFPRRCRFEIKLNPFLTASGKEYEYEGMKGRMGFGTCSNAACAVADQRRRKPEEEVKCSCSRATSSCDGYFRHGNLSYPGIQASPLLSSSLIPEALSTSAAVAAPALACWRVLVEGTVHDSRKSCWSMSSRQMSDITSSISSWASSVSSCNSGERCGGCVRSSREADWDTTNRTGATWPDPINSEGPTHPEGAAE